MKTIFAISYGSYSDYSVIAVCTDKDTAERWAEFMRNDHDGWHRDAEVEELLLLAPGSAPKKRRYVNLFQELMDDGETSDMQVFESSELPLLTGNYPPRRPEVRFVRAPAHRGVGGRLEIRGASKKAVMKVYSDEHRMWAANPPAYRRGRGDGKP